MVVLQHQNPSNNGLAALIPFYRHLLSVCFAYDTKAIPSSDFAETKMKPFSLLGCCSFHFTQHVNLRKQLPYLLYQDSSRSCILTNL